MPNWVTVRINAPKHVIQAILNKDGKVDFSVICPFPGPNNEWDGISYDAERFAQIICNISLNNDLAIDLEYARAIKLDFKKLSDESFSQFIGMLENYRACGYLHSMDFARTVWGTKWNACDSIVYIEEGKTSFETAWSCPDNILIELSKRFPEDFIYVVFADEDIGSNCGKFTLKNGIMIDKEIAPDRCDMDAEQEEKWTTFAYEVKGRKPEDNENEIE